MAQTRGDASDTDRLASGGATDIYFCLWDYVGCVDYGTPFLTIDDISNASNGRTFDTSP